jgi:two-component system chemotaxis sensor kinase CheA
MITTDMSQYLDVFLDEGREQLVLLEANILEMERGNHTLEMLQVLFRAAHTLKGSSRAMGFLAIGDLTHEMENILDALRLDQLAVSTPIVNVLLDCLDALGALVDSVGDSGADTGATGKDIPALVARLNTLRTGAAAPAAPPPTTAMVETAMVETAMVETAIVETAAKGLGAFPLADHEQAGIDAAAEAGLSVYQISVTLTEDCLMKSVRAWMVLSALEPLGSVLASDPGEEALEAEEFERSFRLLFAAETAPDQIETALGGISELETVEVRAWKTPKGAAEAAPLVLDSLFPVADHERASLVAATEAGLTIYQINVTLASECSMKSVRAWMVLSALEPLGSVLASDPGEEILDTEEFGPSFRLLFAAETAPTQIEAALSTVSEMESVTVLPWKAPKAAVATAAAPTPPAPSAAEKAPVLEKAAPQSQTIRVEVSRLDSLLNLVGELVIERAQMHRISSEIHLRYPRDEEAGQLLETTHRIARVTAELQDQIMKARMLPIDGVFQRMPRMVRDLAQKTGKEIQFEMSGGETELDRTVLEVLSDPLIHLLRNSVDHGVEPPEGRAAAGKPAAGIVTLSARHEENHIIIEVADDGRGMDPAKLKESAIRKGLLTEGAAAAMSGRDALGLIFASGFSTAAVLSDISGRGVGMDIVKSNLEKVGGRILIDSVLGRGSKFTIHLPLTLAIVRAVLVEATGGTYVLPLGSVVEMLRLGTSDGETALRTLGGQAVIHLRGRTIPLANLSDLLCGNPEATRPERISGEAYVVVAGVGDQQVGLCVDALVGEQEVVIKSVGTLLGDIPGLSGATILGDGRVALIVDIAKAVAQVGTKAQTDPAQSRRTERSLALHA